MEELALGQKELRDGEDWSFTDEENALILTQIMDMLSHLISVSGPQTLNVALAEISQNYQKGLELSAKPGDLNAAQQSGEAGSDSASV